MISECECEGESKCKGEGEVEHIKENTNIIQVCDVINGESQIQMMSLAFEVLPNSAENNDGLLNTTSTITDITDETLPLENKEEDVNSMKVDDLRKVVVDRQLTSKDEAKKLKKPELLALIKK